jgi:hypothetical protein
MIRFYSPKFIKSKRDGKMYFRLLFDSIIGGTKYLAIPADQKNQRVGTEDLLSEDLRDYLRAQIMLQDAWEEENGTTYNKDKTSD